MYVQNKSARLITFVWKSKKYKLMPAGDAVEVPEEAKASKFLRALEKEGSVTVRASEDQESLLDDIDDLAELREEADDLGITVDKRWGESRLREEIEKAKSEDGE
jgi:hypothetical protein